MEFVDKEINEILNDELGDSAYEMANVSKDDTGLPYNIWIDSLGKDRQNKHSLPRIKVDVNGKLIPITIDDNPDIPESVKKTGTKDFARIAEVKKYIRAYKDVFLAHYNRQITDRQALNLLVDISKAEEGKIQIVNWLNPDR